MLFFSEENYRGNHAGTKARNDAEKIFREYGCKPFNSKCYVLTEDANENIRSSIKSRLDLVPYYIDLLRTRNEIIIFQYPILALDCKEDYLSKLAKNNKIAFLIHDVHSLKFQKERDLLEEIRLLNLADYVIVHNQHMKNILVEKGLNVKKIICLNLFDYLYHGEYKDRTWGKTIVFAGNLGKSDFFESLGKVNELLNFNLYGPNYNQELDKVSNIQYQGNYNPDIIPQKIIGNYGLIWDGDSTETCGGIYGEYTRYNNPHKLSLYLAAGLPVIVWKEAAIAEFVRENNIGITVSSLHDLDLVLTKITIERYEELRKNVEIVREEITKGNYLKNVLNKFERDE